MRSLLAVALSLWAVQIVSAQTKFNPNMVNTMTTATIAPERPKLPSLFGMTLNEAQSTLERMHLGTKWSGPQDGTVIGQEPQAGSDSYGEVIVVQMGAAPRLVLSGPAAPAQVGSDLTFAASFDPPLPPATPVSYVFNWGDGTPSQPSDRASATHRFLALGTQLVRVGAVVNDRLRLIGRLAIDVVEAPVTDTTPTQTQTTVTETLPPPPPRPSSRTDRRPAVLLPAILLLIGVAAVLLFLTIFIRRPRAPEPEPEPGRSIVTPPAASLTIHGGIGSMEHEIEHPEKVRTGLTVRLRGGLRA